MLVPPGLVVTVATQRYRVRRRETALLAVADGAEIMGRHPLGIPQNPAEAEAAGEPATMTMLEA